MEAAGVEPDDLPMISISYMPFDPPPTYLKPPETPVNNLNLPIKNYYTTQDLCKVLNIKPGKYPEAKKVGGKRRFTIEQVREILQIRYHGLIQRRERTKPYWDDAIECSTISSSPRLSTHASASTSTGSGSIGSPIKKS